MLNPFKVNSMKDKTVLFFNTQPMNIKKIKLALTVGLINSGTGSTLGKVRELMLSLKEDVGAMLSSRELKKAVLGPNMVQYSYALQFERCTLNVDVVSHPLTRQEMVRTFYFQ